MVQKTTPLSYSSGKATLLSLLVVLQKVLGLMTELVVTLCTKISKDH